MLIRHLDRHTQQKINVSGDCLLPREGGGGLYVTLGLDWRKKIDTQQEDNFFVIVICVSVAK